MYLNDKDESDIDKSLGSKYMINKIEHHRKIYIGCTIVVVLVLIGVLFGYMRMEKLRIEKKSTAMQQTIAIKEKIKELEDKLTDLREEYGNTINGKSCVILAFTNLAKGDVDGLMEVMDDNGYAGVMVFCDGRTPGDVNCISIEQYNALLEKGWEAAIGSMNSLRLTEYSTKMDMEKWVSYVQMVQQEFVDKDLTVPDVYCFNEDENYSIAEPYFNDLGIRVYMPVYDTGEQGWFSPESVDNTMITGIQADYEYQDISTDIEYYTSMGYSTVLLFNKVEISYPQENVDVNTSIARFKEVVEILQNTDRESMITTITGYQEYQNQLNESMAGDRTEYNQKKSELCSEIELLKEEMKKIREAAGL